MDEVSPHAATDMRGTGIQPYAPHLMGNIKQDAAWACLQNTGMMHLSDGASE